MRARVSFLKYSYKRHVNFLSHLRSEGADKTYQELLLRPIGALCKSSTYLGQHLLSKLMTLPCFNGSLALTEDVLLDTSKVNGLDTTDLLLGRSSSGSGTSGQASSHSIGGSDKGALLDAGSGQLAGHWRPQGLGEASGGHLEIAEGGLRDD